MIPTNYLLYTILTTLSLTTANPTNTAGVEVRNLFQVEPDLVKRTLFNVDDIKDKDHKKFLQDAQKEAVEIAGTALKYMKDEKEKGKKMLDAWFGTAENIEDDVTGVLTKFVGDNKDSEGSSVLGKVIVYDEDYAKKNGTAFCSIVTPEGKSGTAYFKEKNGKPGMHYCPKFFDRKSKADFLKNDCASIANHIDTSSTTRQFRGANVLHEFMHFPEVGKEQTGTQIGDERYGAYDCYVYKNVKDKDGKPVNTVLNADTYVYFALYIWLEVNCKKNFSYPRDARDN